MSHIGIAINIWRDTGGTGGGGSWVLAPGGVVATLDIDFVNNRAWNSPSYVTIPSLLTCSRATPPLAYYTKADGTLITFAPDTLRYGSNGLLVEESRVNLILQSNTFAVTWGNAGITNLTTTTTGPDGVTGSATLINEDTSNGGHLVFQQISKAASALTYSCTVYSQVGPGRTRITCGFYTGATGNGIFSTFDIGGGQVGPIVDRGGGGYTGASNSIQALANGWYRCTTIFTTDTGVTLNFLIENDNGTGNGARSDTYVGVVGNGMYIYGTQIEQAGFATSYIPTTTTSVTRAADAVSLPNATFSFPFTTGSFCAQVTRQSGIGNDWAFQLAVTGTFDWVLDNSGTNFRFGAAASDLTTVGQVTTGKGAGGWTNGGTHSLSVNGGAVTTSGVTGANTGTPDLNIGVAGGNPSNHYLKRFTVWNSRLSNANLQLVST